MRTVPMASKKLPVPPALDWPLASEARRLKLLGVLLMPCGGGGWNASNEPTVVPLLDEGMVAMPEKLRTVGIRGVVLLRLRLCFENMGTVGGAAASSTDSLSSPLGISGTGAGLLPKGRFALGYARGRPLNVSRMGFLRRPAGLGDAVSVRGIGGRLASSSASIDEWLRNESAVSHT